MSANTIIAMPFTDKLKHTFNGHLSLFFCIFLSFVVFLILHSQFIVFQGRRNEKKTRPLQNWLIIIVCYKI
jgi:hypothetical protein